MAIVSSMGNQGARAYGFTTGSKTEVSASPVGSAEKTSYGDYIIMTFTSSGTLVLAGSVWACDKRTSAVGELEAGNDRRVDVVQ